jgi:hypothetical protein
MIPLVSRSASTARAAYRITCTKLSETSTAYLAIQPRRFHSSIMSQHALTSREKLRMLREIMTAKRIDA